MFRSNPGVQRPLLYAVAAVLGVVFGVPLAISTSVVKADGLYDECFEVTCDGASLFASVEK